MVAYKFIHHYHVDNETNKKVVLYIDFSIHSKFWAFEVGLYSVDSAYKFLYMRYFSTPACFSSTYIKKL